MPLDPRIPLGVRPLQLPSPLDIVQTVERIQGLRDEQDVRREQVELRRLAAEEARTKHLRQQQTADAYARAKKIDPKTGRVTFDRAVLVEHLPGELLPALQREFDADDARELELDTARDKYRISKFDTVARANYDPLILRTQVEALQARGALAPDEAAQLLTLTDPAQRKMAVDAYRTPTEAKPELVEYVNAEGKTVKGWKVPTVGEEYVQPSDAENDFTLSAGQIRFGPQGQVIARGPAPQGPQPSYQWAVPPGATTPRLMTPQEIRASGATSVAAAGEAGGVKLTGAQQEDMATMLTVEELIGGVEAIHKEKGGLPGVGPLEGRFFPSQRGSGGPTGETVRNMVGNIQGTIAKLRGGTAFSESEKAMLDSYTPTLTDTDAAIRTKLVNLRDFIQKKRTNTIRVASGQYTLPSTPPATTTTPTTGGAGLGMSYDDYKKRGGR